MTTIVKNVRSMAAMFDNFAAESKKCAATSKKKEIDKSKLLGKHEVSMNNDVVLNIIKDAGFGGIENFARMRNLSVQGYEEKSDFSLVGGDKATWETWDVIAADVDKLASELKEDADKAEIDLDNYLKEVSTSHCNDYEEDSSVKRIVDTLKMPLTHGYYALAFDLDLDDVEDTVTNDEFIMEDEVAVLEARERAQKAMKDFDLFIDSAEDVDFLEQMEIDELLERVTSELPVSEGISGDLESCKTKLHSERTTDSVDVKSLIAKFDGFAAASAA